jgi:hypothetical protein
MDLRTLEFDLIKEKYETDENAFFSIKNKCSVIINTIINLHSSNILSKVSNPWDFKYASAPTPLISINGCLNANGL